MKFYCNCCSRQRNFETEYKLLIINKDKEMIRHCKSCRSGSPGLPDVYFDGKPEENLADDPNTGKPRVFSSKGEKAAYLAERGIREAGDRVHGAPFSSIRKEQVDSRHEVRMALKKVGEMGKDVRRQEYLKITKQGQKCISI